FVCPTPDRVDMVVNYPFDTDRLRRLLIVTDQCLEQHGGYSTLYQISKAVTAAELGGAFLTEHLLADLLRRHGRYEFLPGDMVAQASLGLTGWIQHQAREALRASSSPMSSDQLVAEHPRLAEFGHCLHELLHRDPLVATHDGEAFRLI
ncbi:MAG: hypothetical protein KDB80_06045, partial [Planctomycetes bacterium]|nr:hypothetical protein [Planctomycetota bacterium]